MKKLYMQPSLEMISMEEESLICESIPVSDETVNGEDALSKDRSNYKHEDLGWDF